MNMHAHEKKRTCKNKFLMILLNYYIKKSLPLLQAYLRTLGRQLFTILEARK